MARTMADAFNQYHQGYVKPQVESKVGKNSPAFTGTPTAPTADNDTDSTQIATTEFCQNLIRRLCGVDTKTIALLADLADALLNQPDFRDAVVTVLGNKLDKTDAANTYLTKSDASTTYLSKSTASSTYATKSELSGAGTTYSTGNASTAGITKLYTGTGSATDGTMTQNAITTALNNKADSSALSNKLDTSTWDKYFVPDSNSTLIALKNNPLILNKNNKSNIGATADYVFITENNSGTQFLFKSDGIYIDTKRITNAI